MKLISLLPINLREAEKEKEEEPADTEKDAEGGETNPFASAGGEEGGEDASADDAGGDAEGGEDAGEEGGEGKTSEDVKPLDVVFDPVKVRKYNDRRFKDNKGTVTNISRYGLTVKLADETTLFVNFDDIL